MNKKVTILLATYNGEHYLSEQLESLLNQSYKNIHILIRDDGSSDRTNQIIDRYIEAFPDIVQKIIDNDKNLGPSLNFSRLMQGSDSKYIMFCDQDDVWLPEKVELTLKKMIEAEKSNPNIPLLIHTDLKVVNTDLDILSNSYWAYQGIDPKYDTLNRLLVQNVITGCSVMINKKLADTTLPIPTEAIMHDWWLGLLASSFGQIHHIDTSTILYRQHGNNDTGATKFSIQAILSKLLHFFDLDINKYMVQAEKFLEVYRDQLDDDTIAILENFIKIKDESFLQKRKTLLKYKFLKQGLIRNMGLLARI